MSWISVIKLNERSQPPKKNPYSLIPFIQNSRKCKLLRIDRKQITGRLEVVERRKTEGLPTGIRKPWEVMSVFIMDCGDVYM